MELLLWDENWCVVHLARVNLREIDDEVACNLIEDSSNYLRKLVWLDRSTMAYLASYRVGSRILRIEFEPTNSSRVDMHVSFGSRPNESPRDRVHFASLTALTGK